MTEGLLPGGPVLALSWPIVERIPIAGDVALSPHGVFTSLGVLLGVWVLRRRAERWGLGGAAVDDLEDEIWRIMVPVLLAAIVGARGLYVLRHLDDFVDRPLAALAVWEGGLTLLGGITAGVVAAVVVLVRRGHDVRRVLDLAAPGLAAGIAVGRIGDLAIGDHIGAATAAGPLSWQCTGNFWVRADNAFGRVPPATYPTSASPPPTAGCFDTPVVQTALLDMVAAALVLVAVVAVARWLARHPGSGIQAATFVLAYGMNRLVLDSLRQDARTFGLTASQWAAAVAVLLALSWLVGERLWPKTETGGTG